MDGLWDWLPMILSVAGVVGVGGLLVLLGLWPVVSAFLIGTKTGRIVAGVGAFLLIVWYSYIAGKRTGREKTKAKQKAQTMKAIRERIKIDENVRKMSPSDRRRELNRWVQS